MGVTVQFPSSSSINSLDETLKCESSPFSPICMIKDGMLKFHHVAHEEEASRNACHLIFIER